MQADADHTLAEVLPLLEQLDEIDAERWVVASCLWFYDERSFPGSSRSCCTQPLCPYAWADRPTMPLACSRSLCRRLSKGGSFASGTDTAQPGEAVCNEVRPASFQLGPRSHAGCTAQSASSGCCSVHAACVVCMPSCADAQPLHPAFVFQLMQVLNHCYELLAACVRGAEDVSVEMKVRLDQK